MTGHRVPAPRGSALEPWKRLATAVIERAAMDAVRATGCTRVESPKESTISFAETADARAWFRDREYAGFAVLAGISRPESERWRDEVLSHG